jgi:hypothetical protein
VDAGTPDAGTKVTFGGPGPWPTSNVTYGAADGIQEAPVVGMTTDETQNLWVATHEAIYLRHPGDAKFQRFDASAGLHLQSNPVKYCDSSFGDGLCPIYGGAYGVGITVIEGGGPNEVFVGYQGNESEVVLNEPDGGTSDVTSTDSDPNRHSGKLDRVRLQADGTLKVDRFDMVYSLSVLYWHNRTVYRMVFDHFVHPHDLFVGTNHGVDLLRPDRYAPPTAGEWFLNSDYAWMADHLHPRVCAAGTSCTGDENTDHQLMGEWRGLAINPDGQLWVAGRWTAGLAKYATNLDPNGTPDLRNWSHYPPGVSPFTYAFGDPYSATQTPVGSGGQPVFRPPEEGDEVGLTAVTVTPDGKAWFSSAPIYTGDTAYGVASWDGKLFVIYDPIKDLGMQEAAVRDMVALPDGRLVLAGPNTGLTVYDPATGSHSSITSANGLVDNQVNALELDTMVKPPALHVSTSQGAATIRVFPSR